MTKDYPLNGTKIIMRRLFKYNADEICECFNEYNTLFFNPVNAEFISNIFLHGEFWGAFVCDKLICCCYIYPLDCSFSKKEVKYDIICDFADTPSEYLCMGYIGTNTQNFNSLCKTENKKQVLNSIYCAFLNIAQMQAFRQGYRKVLHYAPVKTLTDLSPVFENDFKLVKMRGLEKLVVHYIFTKSVYPADADSKPKGESIYVALSNTKALSKFLENGYCARDIAQDNNENILTLNLVSD